MTDRIVVVVVVEKGTEDQLKMPGNSWHASVSATPKQVESGEALRELLDVWPNVIRMRKDRAVERAEEREDA